MIDASQGHKNKGPGTEEVYSMHPCYGRRQRVATNHTSVLNVPNLRSRIQSLPLNETNPTGEPASMRFFTKIQGFSHFCLTALLRFANCLHLWPSKKMK